MKTRIDFYINELKIKDLYTHSSTSNQMIEYITYNSKEVKNNTLFICKGANFKVDYLQQAIDQGATCYLSEKKYDVDCDYILVNDIRQAMVYVSAFFYERCWEKLKLIGITGTKGKSTTAFFLKSILDCYLKSKNKVPSAILSSIETYDGKVTKESHITTPEPVELHQFFENAINNNVEFLEMEVSSQALKYHRVLELIYDVVVFLNIGEDHISDNEHIDFEDYFNSKLMIFKQTKVACINSFSELYDRILLAAKESGVKIISFGYDKNDDFQAYDIKKDYGHTVFKVKSKKFDKEFRLTLPGLFNIDNALAAIAVASQYDIPVEYMIRGLEEARVNGRMEVYQSQNREIIGIVDYAHNKLSFSKLFESIQNEFEDYDIRIIFGCPGMKALNRRQELSEIAGENATMTYITEDDPSLESLEEICDEMAKHIINKNGQYQIIYDREEAIKKAVKDCHRKTVIICAAKGNETVQKRANGYFKIKTDATVLQEAIADYEERRN